MKGTYILNLFRILSIFKVYFFKSLSWAFLIYVQHIERHSICLGAVFDRKALSQFINVVISLSPCCDDKHIYCTIGGNINCKLIDKSIKHALLIFFISKYTGMFIKVLLQIPIPFKQSYTF